MGLIVSLGSRTVSEADPALQVSLPQEGSADRALGLWGPAPSLGEALRPQWVPINGFLEGQPGECLDPCRLPEGWL